MVTCCMSMHTYASLYWSRLFMFHVKDASTSANVFHIPTIDTNGHPLNLYIDAADPNFGYTRYSDGPFHNESENAQWKVSGTGHQAQMPHFATNTITYGGPIRALCGKL